MCGCVCGGEWVGVGCGCGERKREGVCDCVSELCLTSSVSRWQT